MTRRSTIAALATGALSAVLVVIAVVSVPEPETTVYAVGWMSFALVGAFLGLRRPRNPIGWIFAVMGLASLAGLVAELAPDWLRGTVPPTLLAATGGLWFVGFDLLPALLILFPDGRPPSRPWRLVLAAIVLVLPIGVLSSSATGTDSANAAAAPLLIELLGRETGVGLIDTLQGVSLLTPFFLVLGVLALRVRFRQGTPTQRLQLKWMTYAGALLALALVATTVAFFSPLRALDPNAEFPAAMFAGVPFMAGLLAVPTAAAIAILRYRLYDIDRIISRTLADAALTAFLAIVYAVGFLGLQAILAPFTSRGGPVAVAASTLAVFALFSPVRRRIQGVVDRRFNRRRYDAAREVDAFATIIRDEVDFELLTVALAATLERTLQPASAAIWLRAGGSAGGGRS